MKNLLIVLFAVILTGTGSAHAALVSVDLYAAGDGLATLDTNTGLQWMDLPPTHMRSFDSIVNDSALAAAGWRLATLNEISGFLGTYVGPMGPSGIGLAPGMIPAYWAGGVLVDSFIGSIADFGGGSFHRSILLYAETFSSAPPSTGNLIIFDVEIANPSYGAIWSWQPYTNYFPWTGANGQGAFLVRNVSPIPEPAAIWLLGSGLMGLIGVARRKRK